MIDITGVMRYMLPSCIKGTDGIICFDSVYKTHKHFPDERLFEHPLKPLVSYSFIEFDMGMGSDIKTKMIDLTNIMKSYLRQKLKQVDTDMYGMECVDGKCVPVCNCLEDCPEGQECDYKEGICVPAI